MAIRSQDHPTFSAKRVARWCSVMKTIPISPLCLRCLTLFFASLVHSGCGDPSSVPTTGDSLENISSEKQVLSEDLRKRVWDIEHLGFVIEATVFPRLKESITDGSLDFWKNAISADTKARTPSDATTDAVVLTGGHALFQSRLFDPVRMSTGNRDHFLEWLTGLRSDYSECRANLGLVRLTPHDENLNGDWTSVWRLRLSGVSAAGPIETEVDIEVLLSELHDDIAKQKDWVQEITVLSHQFVTADQSFFEETTATSGLQNPGRHDNWTNSEFVPNTGGVYVTDYDLDGHLDVFVDDHAGGNQLYRGRGNGTFQDITKQAGIDTGDASRAWTLSCWADLDNDGDDDLIVEDKLYENLGDGRFNDITASTNLPLTPASSYAIADYDLDGLLDIYVCHSGTYRIGQSEKVRVKWIDDGLGIDNVLLRNRGEWQFDDVTVETNSGAGGSACFTAIWLHANDDNRPDLFAINEFGVNSLLMNSESGKFESRAVDAVFGGFSMGAAAGDYNNDGYTDLYVANMYSKAGNRILANVDESRYPAQLYQKIAEGTRGSKLYAGGAESRFQTIEARDMFANIGWAYGPTMADFDNDGWLDLYATAGFKSEERGKPDG